MTGPTRPADDLRDLATAAYEARLVDSLGDVDHVETVRAALHAGKVAQASEAEAWESSRSMATTADTLSARLRGMARRVGRLRERVATQTEINQGWVRYGDRKKAERREQQDALRAALGLDEFDRTRHIPQLIEKAADLRAEVDRLTLEIQGYQVGDPYERGHEHGVLAGLRTARLSGGNTPADAADLATIDERDAAEEWADRLAYAIAPESVIGVHSSGSNPWAHALNLIEAERAASVPDVADSRKRVFVVDAKSGLRTAMRPGRPVRVQFRVDTDPAVATPARAYGLVDVVPAGVDGVIGARSKRTWYRRPEGWLALERPGDPVRLVSEHSLFVLEGSVSPAPSVGADPEDEVLAELREDERQHAELNPKLAAPTTTED